ncbi:MAG: hypothetical protein AAGG56_01650 [Pseudomonadota bacterium]
MAALSVLRRVFHNHISAGLWQKVWDRINKFECKLREAEYLANIDDRVLRDIGRGRADTEREIRRLRRPQ